MLSWRIYALCCVCVILQGRVYECDFYCTPWLLGHKTTQSAKAILIKMMSDTDRADVIYARGVLSPKSTLGKLLVRPSGAGSSVIIHASYRMSLYMVVIELLNAPLMEVSCGCGLIYGKLTYKSMFIDIFCDTLKFSAGKSTFGST